MRHIGLITPILGTGGWKQKGIGAQIQGGGGGGPRTRSAKPYVMQGCLYIYIYGQSSELGSLFGYPKY